MKTRWRQRKQTSKANKDWLFIFFLAKELGMTVRQLSHELTTEELVAWGAFYELKSEEEEKVMDRAKTSRGAQTMRRR